MKVKSLAIPVVSLAMLIASCSNTHTTGKQHHAYASAEGSPNTRHDEDGDDEEDVALDQIPAAVRAAALARLPGLVLVSAEKETEDGVLVYGIAGTLNGKSYEVEVSAAGAVLEVEEVGAHDDDQDGGDDDDDDDDQDD